MAAKAFEPALYLIADVPSVAAGRSLVDLVQAALDGGVTMVQLRHKLAGASELADLAVRLLEVTRPRGIPMVVNDRVDVALAVGADGVHLGGDDIPVDRARELLGSNAIIGATAANPVMALEAQAKGADYLGIGPYRHTGTKSKLAPVLGAKGLARISRVVKIPWVAVGGVTQEDVRVIMRSGAHGIACAGAICRADDPARAARGLVEAVEEWRGRCHEDVSHG